MPMTLVQTITLTSNASGIDFTNIPQTGRDLVVYVSSRDTQAGEIRNMFFRLNGVSANYDSRSYEGTGTSYYVFTTSPNTIGFQSMQPGNDATASSFSNNKFYVANYTATTTKTVVVESVAEQNRAQGNQSFSAGSWQNSAAITSVNLIRDLAFLAGTTASLYIIS